MGGMNTWGLPGRRSAWGKDAVFPPSPGSADAAEPLRILIVDDEIGILDAFSLMLRDLGHSVKTAAGAGEALAIVQEERFDIAFLDQYLGPELGLDLMQRLSYARPDLYFVIITANGNTDLAVESLKRGASDFIVKPFFTADLVKSIEYVRRKMGMDLHRRSLLSSLEAQVSQKDRDLRGVYFAVLSSLAQAMEKRDMGTYGHSKRVSYYSRLIAAALDLDEEECNDVRAAALLHDIGKIGISDFILGKKGSLEPQETEEVRSHPQKGVEILKPLPHFHSILPGILHHHENYDGSGYPQGLAGEEIPLSARIIAVADAYDAIISTRPYRAAADHNKAVQELKEYSGRQFDRRIVEAFVTTNSRYENIFGGGGLLAPPGI